MRSVCSPTSRAWVTMTKVWPRVWLRRRSRAIRSPADSLSRLPVGSSAQTMAGLATMARATARAHDRHHLAAPDGEVDATQRLDGHLATAVGLADATRFDDEVSVQLSVLSARRTRLIEDLFRHGNLL